MPQYFPEQQFQGFLPRALVQNIVLIVAENNFRIRILPITGNRNQIPREQMF